MNRSFYEYFLSRIAQDGIFLESFCSLIVEAIDLHSLDEEDRKKIGRMAEDFVRQRLPDIFPGYHVEKSSPEADKHKGIDAYLIDPRNNREGIQIKQKASDSTDLEVELMVNYNPKWPGDKSIEDLLDENKHITAISKKHLHRGQLYLSKATRYFMTNLYQTKIYEVNNSAIFRITDNVIEGLTRKELPERIGIITRRGCKLKVQTWKKNERRGNPVSILDENHAFRITIEIPWSLIPSSDKKIYDIKPPNFTDSIAHKLEYPDPALVKRPAPISRPARMPAYFEQEFIQAMGGKKTATFTPESNDEKNWLRDLVNKNGYKLEEKGKDFIVKK